VFWDSSNEWQEMSGEDRYSFLVPITVAGYLGFLLVIGGLIAYSHWYFKRATNYVEPVVIVVLVFPAVLWFGFRFVQVVRSINRYNARGRTGTR
jgi:hypothetical protein